MKTQLILAAALMCILSSCSEDEIHIGDRFLLYKSEESRSHFDSIGLDVGGTQRLIRGKIECYGCDSTYVVAKMENGSYYYFEKAAVKKSSRPTDMVEGPCDADVYKRRAALYHFPPLDHFPPRQ